MRNKTKYAAIGYVVSKFVIPIAKKQAAKAAKAKAGSVVGRSSARGTAAKGSKTTRRGR